MRSLLAVVILLGACDGAGSESGPPSAPTIPAALDANATVAAHVDGDTLDVLVDGRRARVRLIGVDTPEIAHPGTAARPGNPAECFGDAAAARTRELLPIGTPVRLERDVVGRDDYGRVLAYVYRAADGAFVNVELVRHGFAQPLSIPPNVTHVAAFVDAARRAEADDVGLWGSCG